MTSSTAPQSLSAERREEVQKLWCFNGGSIYKPLWAAHTTDEYRCTMDDPNFWSFIAAIDAKHAERTTQFQRRADGLSKDFTALQHAIINNEMLAAVKTRDAEITRLREALEAAERFMFQELKQAEKFAYAGDPDGDAWDRYVETARAALAKARAALGKPPVTSSTSDPSPK